MSELTNQMESPEKDKQRTSFYKAVLELKDEAECQAFFEDMCAMSELKSIIQRYEVARMLKENRVYTDIMHEINASSATISRVKRMLNYGTGCLGMILDRVAENEKTEDI